MKQQASVRRTYKKEMVVARSTLVHLRHSARAQPRPVARDCSCTQELKEGEEEDGISMALKEIEES
ncbi:hypothetical protein LguiA_003762 [Lonicera macranthoides]